MAREMAVDPTDYRQALHRLAPGDTLRLAPGRYTAGLPLHGLKGEPQRPIVISGPADGPAILLAAPGRNTVSILNSAHVVVKNLVLDGQDLPVDGVKCEGHADFAHHVTLENLTIRGHGNNQQTVGISTKCPAWNWVIRNNVIIGAGTGMYLGNSDGRAPFVAGLIEHNLIVDSTGYDLQIKHQAPRPDVPGMPQGDNVTVIRHNVFSKATGGSREMARPNLLVGHWPLQGPGMFDRYLIYGNFFYQNPHEALFQGEGNVAFYNNLLINEYGDAVRIQPHNDTPREIDVFHNTVVAAGTGIHLARREQDGLYAQHIEANAIFARVPLSGLAAGENVTASPASVEGFLKRPLAPLGDLDLTPLPGKLNYRPKDETRWKAYADSDRDFDGRKRGQPVAGAYAGSARVRWPLRLEIKPLAAMR